jgi:hypothetical protein
VGVDGAFLVRPGERVLGSYVISFRADNKVGLADCLLFSKLILVPISNFLSSPQKDPFSVLMILHDLSQIEP